MLYFDPDIEIFGDVEHLADLAALHGVVVTPHHLRPLPRDGRTPTEADFLERGIYNLGFIGTGVGAVESGFLEFWSERLERDGLVDYASMMFTDQLWIDFIDCFPHHVVGDPGCNVAYWNVGQRSVTRDGEVPVDGQPLVFFHFSGLDPERPHLLSVNQGERAACFPQRLSGSGRPVQPLPRRGDSRGLLRRPLHAVRVERDALRAGHDPGLPSHLPQWADRGGPGAVEPPPNPFQHPLPFEAWIETAEVGSTPTSRLPVHTLDTPPGPAAIVRRSADQSS